jgi:hypothetical protein
LAWWVLLDDFACFPVHDFRPFSGARGGSRRPFRLLKQRRGYEAPALHANFKYDIGWWALHSLRGATGSAKRKTAL